MGKLSAGFVGARGRVILAVAGIVSGLLLAGLIAAEVASPAYIFINDTSGVVSRYVVGATSPAVQLQLAPGEKRFIDMPFWWGPINMPIGADDRRVVARHDYLLLKVIYLSEFPEMRP